MSCKQIAGYNYNIKIAKKLTRDTNLKQQLWFIIINISTCFGHLYAHLQEYRLYVTAYGVQHCKRELGVSGWCWTPYAVPYSLYSWRWEYRCPKHVEIFMIINHNCCIKLVPLVIFTYDAWSHIHQLRNSLKMWLLLNIWTWH
jgi:hypothetical protein